VLKRIKSLYLSGNPTLEFGCVKKRDRSDAAAAGKERLPKCLQANTVWRDYADACKDHAIAVNHMGALQ
jgi:hypothetical protein